MFLYSGGDSYVKSSGSGWCLAMFFICYHPNRTGTKICTGCTRAMWQQGFLQSVHAKITEVAATHDALVEKGKIQYLGDESSCSQQKSR